MERADIKRTDSFSIADSGAHGKPLSIVRAGVEALLDETRSRLEVYEHTKHDVFGSWHEELLRQAAVRVLGAAGWEYQSYGIFDALTAIAALPYEGRAAAGRLSLEQDLDDSTSNALVLDRVVPWKEHRTLRKLLNVSADTAILGCTQEGVQSVFMSEVPPKGGLFAVSRGSRWAFGHSAIPLFDVEAGQVHIPRMPPSRAQFERALDMEGLAKTAAHREVLWGYVSALILAARGGLLAIAGGGLKTTGTSSASFTASPVVLEPALIVRLATVDGAIVVDDQGRVHALGVILAGPFAKGERPDRGARFNSGLRFVKSVDMGRVAVVISDDGMVDVLHSRAP
jgi:hypothetical protein